MDSSAMIKEDILLYILSKLEITDLKTSRLVDKFWCMCSTRIMRERTKAIKITREMHGQKLTKLATTIENATDASKLPFTRYHLDLSQRISRSQNDWIKIFDCIVPGKCHQLKLIFKSRPETPNEASEAAAARSGLMKFVNLINLNFKIHFHNGFSPSFVNMEELFQQSEGLKRVSLTLTTNPTTKGKYQIVSNTLTCLTNPKNKFRELTSLGLEFTYLTSEHLNILTAWAHPLKNLALGTFDLKPDKPYEFPKEELSLFLKSQKDYLVKLRIRVGKKYEWVDTTEDIILDGQRIPRFHEPNQVNFPKMSQLQSFEIIGANFHNIDVGCAWRLDNHSLEETFPKLKKFGLIKFSYKKGDSPSFLPRLDRPSQTVEYLTIPGPSDLPDIALLHRMISLFPNTRSLEIQFNQITFEKICLSMPALEKLVLHLGEDLINLDSVLTGCPILELKSPSFGTEAESFNIEAARSRPSLTALSNLKELFITTEDYYVRITDVTAYHVFLKMNKFSRLRVDAYPWEDTTEWTLSPGCMETLKQQVKMTLNIYKKSFRHNFFKFS